MGNPEREPARHQFKNLKAKRDEAGTKLAELDQADNENKYQRAKSDIVRMMNDIDGELRSAMAYLIQ